ncbi:SusC/RagA family TonB-linked outer membrane protein [Dinghuibacter silviterrae]|uniref:TonB-linked SusC/RagA family outer membrane protein n=1 Tax=Dinghuibacter silviterrae TaxID=1539049 RepID=A0A4V3GKU2_9BACT|nr:TonB-dependent receptor [Dinghuibacter silviterrae]TDW96942.1 TonB-linked SusC/RagA family outer membrane protein [Dinghuibacter silviterrae]
MKMNALRYCLLLLCLSLFYHPTIAQNILASGKVTDKTTGLPLAGATVTIKGTPVATTTDVDGSFLIKIPPGHTTVIVTFAGYEPQELEVHNGRLKAKIALIPSEKSLDDVVVIGYGTVKKRDLTGSVSTVKASDIVRSPTGNALEAIQGMVPGMDIVQTSGQANANVNIEIRGTRTFSGNTAPLFIVDGVQGVDPTLLNPNDIASIDVLKDASSTAIYGSQGANGVVIVTTKKGVAGQAKVSYSGYYGVDGWSQFPEPLMGQAYINLRRAAYQNTNPQIWNSPADDSKIFSATELAGIQAGQWVNWIKLIQQNGIRESHSVSVSGGSDKTKAYLSASYYKNSGMVSGNDLTRYNALLNLDQTVTSWFKAGMKGALTYSNVNVRGSDPYSRALYTSPIGVPYDSNGNINVYPEYGNTGVVSPLADNRGAEISTNNTVSTNVAFNGYVDLTPLKGLKLSSVFGVNLANSRQGQFFDSSSLEEVNTKYSYAAINTNNNTFYNWENILNYNHGFGDHQFDFTALTSYTHENALTYSAAGTNLVYNSQLFYNLSGTSALNRTITSNYGRQDNMSYGARLNYGYKGRYLLTLTERVDGASILAPGHKWASFPSAAVAWRMGDETFMHSVRQVSELKWRLSYGVTGNAGITQYGTQSYLINQTMGFENTAAPAYIFNTTIGNENLGWELSKTADFGMDLGLFKNRLNVTADIYNTNTTNIIMPRSLPPSLGVGTTLQNIGSTRNQGIELAINSQNIRTHSFSWSTTLTFTSNREKITGLISGTNIIDGTNPETASLLLGRPIHSFYNYEKLGIWQTSEATEASGLTFGGTAFQPGDIKLADLNHDGKISPDSDRTYIGSAVPKWSSGFLNTFTYKNFDLSVYTIVRWGQMIQDNVLGWYNPAGQGNNSAAYFNYWTPANPTNDYPRPKANESLASVPGYTTLEYVNGSYFKLKTATLGYTLPRKVIRHVWISNLRAYVTCNNIYVKAKSHLIKYYDPEEGGADSAPLTRQLVFGLTVGF